MLDSYTVSFFGHRTVHNAALVADNLKKIITEIVKTKENVTFLVGEHGFFDIMCSAIIHDVRKEFGVKNTSLVLVMPYMSARYRDHPESFHKYYDVVEICEESSKAHYKAAFGIRHRSMVDRSDLVVCCIEREDGGAYKAVKYAKNQNKKIINTAVI